MVWGKRERESQRERYGDRVRERERERERYGDRVRERDSAAAAAAAA